MRTLSAGLSAAALLLGGALIVAASWYTATHFYDETVLRVLLPAFAGGLPLLVLGVHRSRVAVRRPQRFPGGH